MCTAIPGKSTKSTMQAVLDRYGLVEHCGGCCCRAQGTALSAGQRANELWTDYKSEFSRQGNTVNGTKREQRTFRYARMHVEVAALINKFVIELTEAGALPYSNRAFESDVEAVGVLAIARSIRLASTVRNSRKRSSPT
jgi:hypothetical protein